MVIQLKPKLTIRFYNVSVQYPKLPLQKPHCLGTGVKLLSLTALVGDVTVSGGKTGSTVNISGARPSAGTVSCRVAELKGSEASRVILVIFSAAWK